MSAKNTRSFVASFLKSSNDSVILAAIAAGLYPILFYYSNNFQLVNTWQHFLFFVASFIGLPATLFLIVKKLFVKSEGFAKVAAVCGTFFRSIYFFVFNENMFVCRHTKKDDTWYCFNSRHTGLFFMETV